MKPTMTNTYYTLSSHHVISTYLYLTTWWSINKKFRFPPEYTHSYSQLTQYSKQIPPIKDPNLLDNTSPTTLLNLTPKLYPTQCTLPLKILQPSHHTPQTPPLTALNHNSTKKNKILVTIPPHPTETMSQTTTANTTPYHYTNPPYQSQTHFLIHFPISYTPHLQNLKTKPLTIQQNTKHTPTALTYSQLS